MLTDVVLFSGGMDSAAILLGRPKETTLAVFYWYGQSHSNAEGAYASRFTKRHGYTLERLHMSGISGGVCGGGDSPVVPGRNALFLAHACSFADARGAHTVWIGCTREDRMGFPDCRPKFIRAFNEMLAASEQTVRVRAPLLLTEKSGVASLLRDRGGDPGETWSCYDPQPMPNTNRAKPCGACGACVVRGGL